MSLKIAIASGKGGTGKTSIATNLFKKLLKEGEKTILVDCDVEEPNDALFFPEKEEKEIQKVEVFSPIIDTEKCIFCRKCVEYCEFNAITVIPSAQYASISPELCHSCGACLYACENDAVIENNHEIGKITTYELEDKEILIEGNLKVGSAHQTPVIRELKKYTKKYSDIIIYDAPPGTSCSVVATLSDVDFVILVTEPTPFGLNDLKIAVELVRELKRPFGIIVNKAGMGNDELYDYLKDEKIETLAKIPFDKKIAKAYSRSEILLDSIENYSEYFSKTADKILKLKSKS